MSEKTMTVNGYQAIFEQTADGSWSATVPGLPTIATGGDTLDEAKGMVAEAIGLWIEVAKEKGILIPPPRNNSLTPDGYGQRTVDGFHVLANCHIDQDGGVWWHAQVWSDRVVSPTDFWITGNEIRRGLESHYMLPDGSNSFVIGDIVRLPKSQHSAILEAIQQLNVSRLARKAEAKTISPVE